MKLIVAKDLMGSIGKDNTIPWKISEDLQYFKSVTMGHKVLMGRKTWDSIPELPGRECIVLSKCTGMNNFQTKKREVELRKRGATLVKSFKECYPLIDENTWCIGGEQIYRQCMSERIVDEVHLTLVHTVVRNSDATFPCTLPSYMCESWKTTKLGEFVNEDGPNYSRFIIKKK